MDSRRGAVAALGAVADAGLRWRAEPRRSRHEHAGNLRAASHRSRRATVLGCARRLHGQGRRWPAQVLLPVDAAVSVRGTAYGPRAQLHHRRRDQPLPAHAGPQRAAADGLGRVRPARRERRDQKQHRAGAVDLRQHRGHARPAQGTGLRDRLVARVRHLSPRVLRARAAPVHASVQARPGVPQEQRGQLGSGGPDRAGQRAGRRWSRLAFRRAGGKARDPAVVFEDHRLR